MNLPGTKASQFNDFPVLTLEEMQSPLCVYMLIQQRVEKERLSAQKILEMPSDSNATTNVWLYEHLRYVIMQLGILVANMRPVCSQQSCPILELDDAEILCAAHGKLRQCPAIDYCDHVLQKASQTLNSSLYFPSRTSVDAKSAQHFPSIARRIKRILLHCEKAHVELWQRFEGETRLAERLDLLVGLFGRISAATAE